MMKDFLLLFGDFPMAIYGGAFLLSFIFLLLNFWGVGDADADIDVDTDMDTDVDIEVDTESSGSNVLDAEMEADDPHFAWRIMSFFGFGKVPLSIWIFTLLMSFGVTGLIANYTLFAIGGTALVFGLSIEVLLGASAVAGFMTKFISRLLAPITTRSVSNAITSKYDLEGKIAVLEFDLKKGASTFAHVHDEYGTREFLGILIGSGRSWRSYHCFWIRVWRVNLIYPWHHIGVGGFFMVESWLKNQSNYYFNHVFVFHKKTIEISISIAVSFVLSVVDYTITPILFSPSDLSIFLMNFRLSYW